MVSLPMTLDHNALNLPNFYVLGLQSTSKSTDNDSHCTHAATTKSDLDPELMTEPDRLVVRRLPTTLSQEAVLAAVMVSAKSSTINKLMI